jgi:hypothetical protein
LTCSSTGWWPRVRYDVSRTELIKLQRLGCLAITTAVGLLLGLPVLHQLIEGEAQVGIHRFMCTQQWSHKSTNFGHTKKAQDMEQEPIQQFEPDRKLPRYVYHKPFMVKFPDKCEW